MAELTFYVFTTCALLGLFSALREPVLFVTFPVVTSAVWLAYIVPQAYGILYNPQWLPPQVFAAGFPVAMVMSTLCLLAGILGWRSYGVTKPVEVPRTEEDLNEFNVLVFAIILIAISTFAQFRIYNEAGGILQYYSVRGAYDLDWIGEEVIFAFFKKMTWIASTCLMAFLFFRRRNIFYGLLLFATTLQPLADILILNRRSEVIFLGLSICVPLFFVRSWWPSRPMIIVALMFAAFVVFAFPIIRGSFLLGAQTEQLVAQDVVDQAVSNVVGGEVVKEFNNSIGIIATFWQSGEYSFGADFWNSWVERTVPRTLVGSELKAGLKLDTRSFADLGAETFNWRPVPYMSVSSSASLFANFWFFGAGIFFLIGRYFRQLFVLGVSGDPLKQIQYSMMVVLLPHYIAIGFSKALRQIVVLAVIMFILELVAVSRRREVEPATQ